MSIWNLLCLLHDVIKQQPSSKSLCSVSIITFVKFDSLCIVRLAIHNYVHYKGKCGQMAALKYTKSNIWTENTAECREEEQRSDKLNSQMWNVTEHGNVRGTNSRLTTLIQHQVILVAELLRSTRNKNVLIAEEVLQTRNLQAKTQFNI